MLKFILFDPVTKIATIEENGCTIQIIKSGDVFLINENEKLIHKIKVKFYYKIILIRIKLFFLKNTINICARSMIKSRKLKILRNYLFQTISLNLRITNTMIMALKLRIFKQYLDLIIEYLEIV